ncbi:hypothetical protein H3V53_05660 [Paraburkholderia bengalensis]|uniref:Uncharacterized protein n=1 Tax=Paraburkholderia bengalensis TaxID=2747562 RepID=A0ABU8IMI2_9BURK
MVSSVGYGTTAASPQPKQHACVSGEATAQTTQPAAPGLTIGGMISLMV